jgi:hypothetical protein
MIRKIAIALALIGWMVMPSAYASVDYYDYHDMSSAYGYGSGSGSGSDYGSSYGSGSGDSYGYGSGSSYSSGSGSSYTPPGDISMGSGSGYGYGSGSGCTYGCTVPEPETFFLMGIGMLGLYLARRRG